MPRPRMNKPPCAVEGCDRRSACKDLCAKHWLRLTKWEKRGVVLDRPPPSWSETTIAWAAGVLEGEAYFRLKPSPLVRINMTDEDVVRAICQRLGMGRMSGQRPGAKPQHKPQWVWYVARRQHLVPLLRAMRPWMGKRRGERIDAMLEVLRPTDNFHLYYAKHLASLPVATSL